MSFFAELKRRKVFGAALSYAVIAWLLLQVSDVLLPVFDAPDWVLKLITVLLLLGFPIVIVASWFFQLTMGLEKEVLQRTAGPATDADGPVNEIPPASVAVLPLVNVSSDADSEYFSDGLSLEILNALVRIPELRVPGRTSSFHFKGHTGKLADIGRELGVRTLLEGSVRKVRNTVRVSVQLVDAKTGFHLWSEIFDRELGDLLRIQDEIARTVADKLQVKLLGKPPAPSVENADAYNAYLRGRFFWNKRTREDYLRAHLAYREALALDPNMTAAQAGIADVCTALAIEGENSEWYRRAREAATTVLRLDESNVDGHVSQARLAMYCDWDWQAAERHIARALELNPSNPGAQAVHARFLTFVGRLEPALAAQREALQLDPLALIHNRLVGALLYYCGRYSEALVAIHKTIELDAKFQSSHFNLGSIHLAQNHAELALKAFEQEPHVPLSLTGQAIALHALGRDEQSRRVLAELIDEHGKAWGYQVAQVHAQNGQTDLAFEWLHRALAERDAGLLSIGVDPLMEPLRTDDRFRAMLGKIGLAAYFDDAVDRRIA